MLVYFAVILTVLIGFCGLALDTGLLQVRTLQLQAAADAGAIGAANEIAHNDQNNLQQAAISDIATYESLNGMPGTAPDNPSPTGSVSGDYSTVTVTLHQAVNTIFMGVLSSGSASVTLAARAVAGFPPCMFFFANPNLNSSASAFWLASAGVDSVLGCPVYSKSGVTVDGFARLAGMQVKNSGPASASLIQGNVSVTPLYNVPVMSDPLAYLVPPALGSCSNSSPLSYTTSVSLPPGTYCGKTVGSNTTPAVSVAGTYGSNSCTSNPVLTLSPGLYIFTGGLSIYCATVNGTGVTMYFTKTTGGGWGIYELWGSSWNVSAPINTSNNGLPGIVIFFDRNWNGGNQDFQMLFSNWVGDGVVYVTNTGVYDWQTSMSAPHYMNIVAANMYLYNGEVRPSLDYSTLPAGNPLQTVVTLVQ